MENASKALIMAGSVLLSMLIIGALIFMFNSLNKLKQTEASSEDVQKLAEYNRQIEKFNMEGLYGSEVLSLANLIDDYNIRQSELKGYTEIELEVYTKAISGSDRPIIKTAYKNDISGKAYINLVNDFNTLQTNVSNSKSKKVYGQTVEKWTGMRTEARKKALQDQGYNETQIQNIIYDDNSELNKAISTYTNLKAELTEFKNKKFAHPDVDYDKHSGRIIKMVFKEYGV